MPNHYPLSWKPTRSSSAIKAHPRYSHLKRQARQKGVFNASSQPTIWKNVHTLGNVTHYLMLFGLFTLKELTDGKPPSCNGNPWLFDSKMSLRTTKAKGNKVKFSLLGKPSMGIVGGN